MATKDEMILEHAQATAAVVKRASDVVGAAKLTEKRAAEMIPGVVESLVAAKLIRPEQSEKVAEILKNPLQALDLLKRAADRMAGLDTQALGQPISNQPKTEKTGAYRNGFVGQRPRGERESDRVFAAHFGVNNNQAG